MNKKVPITGGGTFTEPADWCAFLRKAIDNPYSLPSFDINPKYDYMGLDRLLGQLHSDLQGTGLEVALSNAELTLIESGSLDEMNALRTTEYESAPDAYDRLLNLVTGGRSRLQERQMLDGVFERLLSLRPEDSRGLQALLREAETSTDPGIFDVVARFAPAWLAEHLPPLADWCDPFGWVSRAPLDQRRQILDSIASAGPAYVQRTIEPLLDPEHTELARAEMEKRLGWHPVFAQAITKGRGA